MTLMEAGEQIQYQDEFDLKLTTLGYNGDKFVSSFNRIKSSIWVPLLNKNITLNVPLASYFMLWMPDGQRIRVPRRVDMLQK